MVLFLINNPELVLFGLQAGSVVEICQDTTGSPADDWKESLHTEVWTHSSGAVSDTLGVRNIFSGDELYREVERFYVKLSFVSFVHLLAGKSQC